MDSKTEFGPTASRGARGSFAKYVLVLTYIILDQYLKETRYLKAI